jgi:thermitase
MKLSPRRVTVGIISAALAATTLYVPSPSFAAPAGSPAVRLIVGYKNGADISSAKRTLSAMGGEANGAEQALAALGAEAIKVPAARSLATMAALRMNPAVDYVEVDNVRKATDVVPNDPKYAEGRQPELKEVNLQAAWGRTTGSAVKIAVVDTGVNAVGDLSGAVLGGHDFVNNDNYPSDDYGHGTAVSSLIAGRGNDGSGMAGVCWQCKIIPVKVLDNTGSGYDSDVAKGIIYAVSAGATVINMSLGGAANSAVLNNATKWATLKNVLIVAAAGNSNTSKRFYPAAYADVLSVGATETGTNVRASYSNYNSATDHWVDVVAPGTATVMTDDGDYQDGRDYYHPKWQGTSFASPIVAGIAGLVKTVHPAYTGWSLQRAIVASAHKVYWSNYGKVDAAAALNPGTDGSAPYLKSISPGEWVKVHGTIGINLGGVGDGWSGVRDVELIVDGKWKTYDASAPYQLPFSTAGRNGTIKLGVKVVDKAGNWRIYYRNVWADNVAPAVSITKAPKNGAKISGTVKIYSASSDKYGVSRVQLLINGKVVQTHQTSKVPFSFVASKFPKTVTVQVRAYDVAGNAKTTAKLTYHR